MKTNGQTSSVDHYFATRPDGKTARNVSETQSPTINLRFAGGEEKAFPYSDLIWSDFNPSRGILLHMSSHTVMIEGRNLEPLYRQIIQFALRDIVEESEEHSVETATDVPVVEKLRAWTKPEPTGDPWGLLPMQGQ